MKKASMLTATLLISVVCLSQARFGFKGGLNAATLSYSNGGTKFKSTALAGYHGGVMADVPVTESISWQPEVLYSLKGGKDGTVKTMFSGIELPLTFVYKFSVGNGHIYTGLGPSLFYAFSLAQKYGAQRQTYKLGSGEDQTKAFDIGGNFTAGYEFGNGIIASIKFSPGFRNLNNDGTIWKNKLFGFSVGYLLASK